MSEEVDTSNWYDINMSEEMLKNIIRQAVELAQQIAPEEGGTTWRIKSKDEIVKMIMSNLNKQ